MTDDVYFLVAEDDDDDFLLIEESFESSRVNLVRVKDGIELLDFLRSEEEKPSVVILDLNMPRMNGMEALRILKGDDQLKQIPVIVMTTSKSEEDILKSYKLHANTYVTKPPTFQDMEKIAKVMGNYWLGIASLP